jgi:O-methyltransferase involved in polyketide biosynthesis
MCRLIWDPESILSAPALRETLDFSRPVALSLNAVLHFVSDERGAQSIVSTLKETLAPGSALVISHGTADFAPVASSKATDVYRASVSDAVQRTRDEVAKFFVGWDLVEPGIVTTHRWRPDEQTGASGITDAEASCYAAVAFKLG